MADEKPEPSEPVVSPYLRRPIRELKDVQKEEGVPDSELPTVPGQ
jgi:hypothetical protein